MRPDSDMAQQPPTVHEVGSRPQLIHCQNCKTEVMTVIELITNDENMGFGVLGSLLCLCNCALGETSSHGGKGQLNSEWIYKIIVAPEMPTKIF